jgi:hypothetical protein
MNRKMNMYEVCAHIHAHTHQCACEFEHK